jgi:hypothetical protein
VCPWPMPFRFTPVTVITIQRPSKRQLPSRTSLLWRTPVLSATYTRYRRRRHFVDQRRPLISAGQKNQPETFSLRRVPLRCRSVQR